jgi:hypothetical protein
MTTPSLTQFQTDLALALRDGGPCTIDPESPGLRFTTMVRRSWCEGRSVEAARAVLALLPPRERHRLVAAYVDCGGGVAAFLPTESETLLPFLAQRLPNPSHALTLCKMDLALARARLGAADFVAPTSVPEGSIVIRGPYATLVWFHADPAAVMAAIGGAPPPPVGPPCQAVLFAPGLPNLFRLASRTEAAFWDSVPTADTRSPLIGPLLRDGAISCLA